MSVNELMKGRQDYVEVSKGQSRHDQMEEFSVVDTLRGFDRWNC